MIYVVTLLLSWAYVTTMHEVAHAIVAWRRGATKIVIWPFWHWTVPDTVAWYPIWEVPPKPRSLYFARMDYDGPRISLLRPGDMFSLAPTIMDVMTCLVGFAGFALTDHPASLIPIACALFDAGMWFNGYFSDRKHTDGYRFRYGRGS